MCPKPSKAAAQTPETRRAPNRVRVGFFATSKHKKSRKSTSRGSGRPIKDATLALVDEGVSVSKNARNLTARQRQCLREAGRPPSHRAVGDRPAVTLGDRPHQGGPAGADSSVSSAGDMPSDAGNNRPVPAPRKAEWLEGALAQFLGTQTDGARAGATQLGLAAPLGMSRSTRGRDLPTRPITSVHFPARATNVAKQSIRQRPAGRTRN